MTLAADTLQVELRLQPERLAPLRDSDAEFLRWLIQKYLGERPFKRFLEEVDPQAQSLLSQVTFEDIFPDTATSRDKERLIAELAALARALRYQRVLVLMDVALSINTKQLDSLLDLFESMKLMSNRGFAIAIALPATIYRRHQIGFRSNSRTRIFELEWSAESVKEIAELHLKAATQGQWEKLENLASKALLAKLSGWLEQEYAQPTPQGWVNLVQILLESATQNSTPLDEDRFKELTTAFYTRHMPLCFDLNSPQPGIWRGPRFIALEEQPYNFLRALCDVQATAHVSIGQSERALFKVAGTKGNIHTLARRVRLAIEPDLESPIYIKNTRSEGYWLEHCLNHAGP
jgi:hypothetical protein